MAEITLLERPFRDASEIEDQYLDAIVREDVFPSGAFQIGLPKLWTVRTFGAHVKPTPDNPVVELARAVPGVPEALGASHDAVVRVWCVQLPRVINGADWLLLWAQGQGYTIHQFRDLPTGNGIMGDAVMTSDKTGHLHRMITMKDGDLIYLVDGSVDPKGAPDNLSFQEIALMAAFRFKLLTPSGAKYAEPMSEEFLTSDLGQAVFFLPQSWTAQPVGDAPPKGAVAQYTTDLAGVTAGTLVVATGDLKATAEELEDALLAKLAAQGQVFGPPEKTLEAKKGDYHFSTWRHVSQDEEVFMLSLRGDAVGFPFSACLVTPAPTTAFETYAINRRVFEILVESHAVGIF